MRKAGIKYKDRRMIWALYKDEMAVIRFGSSEEEAKIKAGVRQGCSLSPALFNLYIQHAIDEMREDLEDTRGIRMLGEKIDMVRYADDIALVAESEEELAEALHAMENVLIAYNMKINKSKTKVMVVSTDENKTTNIQLNGTPLNNVRTFPYLGSKITSDGRASQEIGYRLHQARLAFNKKSKIFESNNISLGLRKRMLKTLVWSILLYGCETWCISEKDLKKLEAFEMWCYRRMLRISWQDHITNEEVLTRMEEKKV